MTSQSSSTLFVAGLVMGGVAGAGLALFLAPQSGQAILSQIRAKSLALKEGAVEGLTDAGHRAQAQADAWQEKGQEVTDAISQSKDSIVQAVNQSKDRVVEAVGSSNVD